MKPDLHLVAPEPKPETVGEKVCRLQAEAQQLAADHITQVVLAMFAASKGATEIATGGAAYPDGVRQEMERLAQEVMRRLSTIDAIMGRQ